MAKQQQKKLEHFSHKHPLTLVEIEEENVDLEQTSENNSRSYIRCYACTKKITSGGGPYYRCEEGCPLFYLHQSCADMPMTTKEYYHHDVHCNGVLTLTQYLRSGHENSNGVEPEDSCSMCLKPWYRFSYTCFECEFVIDMRCAWTKSEDKHPFHEHPVYPASLSPQEAEDQDLQCSVCGLTLGIVHDDDEEEDDSESDNDGRTICYRCHYCNFSVHPSCTPIPIERYSPSHPHKLLLTYNFGWVDPCEICEEEIDTNSQWAYGCDECDYWTHVYDCSNTIREKELKHFSHNHPLVFVKKALDNTSDSIAEDCHGCRQKISCGSYYTCKDCKRYHLHELCADLPMEMEHQMHPGCTLQLLTGLDRRCSLCRVECKAFAYHCSSCNFGIDVICAHKALPLKKDFHPHPVIPLFAKASIRCHACDRDHYEDISYQCTTCHFWVQEQCASLPRMKNTSSHEHNLSLSFSMPESLLAVDIYCQICRKYMKHHNWAYHCYQCRYFTHVYDCSNPHRDGDEAAIRATNNVIHLPLPDEIILENKVTMVKHHHNPMILFADQFELNSIDITPAFINLIRGSNAWPTFHIDGRDYSGSTFSFYKGKLVMQITSIDLPHYIEHEAHPHVLKSIFLNTCTWCSACEQPFYGCGYRCMTCAFTIDTYCALLPKTIKHRYDKHPFPLTYSAIEDVEEYVCEICEEDVIPKCYYHCVDCDQSIHARCIWQAYNTFECFYRFQPHRCPVTLVPPSKDLPRCIICDEQETFGHGFAFLCRGCNFMVHLTCTSEDEVKVSQNVEDLSEDEVELSQSDEDPSEDEVEVSQNEEAVSEDEVEVTQNDEELSEDDAEISGNNEELYST